MMESVNHRRESPPLSFAWRPVLMSLAWGLCGMAQAQVYKCEAPGGRITYQSQPCSTGAGAALPLPAAAAPVEAHGHADCVALRSSFDEMADDRRRIERELRTTEQSDQAAPAVLGAYRSRLAAIDDSRASLQQRMDRVGCMAGAGSPRVRPSRDFVPQPGVSAEVDRCQRLKHAIDVVYQDIESMIRSRRQSDPAVGVAMGPVGGAIAARDDQTIGAEQEKIRELTRRGEQSGCRQLGVFVGASAAQHSMDMARHCRTLEDNWQWHRRRVAPGRSNSDRDAADGAAELGRIETEMRRYDCPTPR